MIQYSKAWNVKAWNVYQCKERQEPIPWETTLHAHIASVAQHGSGHDTCKRTSKIGNQTTKGKQALQPASVLMVLNLMANQITHAIPETEKAFDA